MAIKRDVVLGQIVYWYVNGDTNHGAAAAIVTNARGGGIVDLNVFSKGMTLVKRSVHHVHDPILSQHDSIAREYGGWDYKSADGEYQHVSPSMLDETKPGKATKIDVDKILGLDSQGKTPGEIAKSIGKKQEIVEEVLKEQGRLRG